MKLFRKKDKKGREGAPNDHLPDISPAPAYGSHQQQQQQQQPQQPRVTKSTFTTTIPPPQQQQPSRSNVTTTTTTRTIPASQAAADVPQAAVDVPPQQQQRSSHRASSSRHKKKKHHKQRSAPDSQQQQQQEQQEQDDVVPDLQPPQRAPAAAGSPSPRAIQQNMGMSMSHMPSSDVAVTRELVKKFIADIWNRGDLDLIPDVCSRSLRFNGSVGMDRVGHEGFARMVQTIREALSDYHCEIHSMVVEGNKAFARMRFTGRHTGALLGFEPTGRQVAWMGASEFTVKDGKIIKVWELGDVKSLEGQLMAPMEEDEEEEEDDDEY